MTTSAPVAAVHVQAHGKVGRRQVDYARHKTEAALRYAHAPVLSARVRLARLPDPAMERPCLAQANLDLNGRPIRAQVISRTMHEAVDELHDRVRDQLLRAAGDWEAIRGGRPQPSGEWRHQSVHRERPLSFLRPSDEREVVRHKAFALRRMTVEEAASDLELLDYDFHLFTELGTGSDSVLYRAEDGSGLRLAQLDPKAGSITPGETPVTVSALAAPTLTLAQARERLDVTGWPFVFFRNAVTGRGNVVYHRYDGDDGLIEPAA